MYDADQQVVVAGDNSSYLNYDDVLNGPSEFDTNWVNDYLGPQGMESLESNWNIDNNFQIQPNIKNEPMGFPYNDSSDLQQEHLLINTLADESKSLYNGNRDDELLFPTNYSEINGHPQDSHGGYLKNIPLVDDPIWNIPEIRNIDSDINYKTNQHHRSPQASHPVINLEDVCDITDKAEYGEQNQISNDFSVLKTENEIIDGGHLAKRRRIDTSTPTRRTIKEAKGKNASSRTANRINFDSTLYYEPLSSIPQSWGTVKPGGKHTFRYNSFGEFLPGIVFTSNEMLEYLFAKFPQPIDYNSNSPRLLIQCVPADSGNRYPTSFSSKCRFKDCPVKTNTIHKGHFRVAFDEHSDDSLDPYHCAGFVHLYCLERFCHFTTLVQYCNFVPDNRELREGRNRMAITRDHSEFYRICMVYIDEAKHRDLHQFGWEYRNTLCSLLTEENLKLESRVRRATRNRNGGNNIGIHRNDLEMYARGEEEKQQRVREELAGKEMRQRLKKRKRSSSDVNGSREDEGGHNHG